MVIKNCFQKKVHITFLLGKKPQRFVALFVEDQHFDLLEK
jgi:hypothetical protein